jgi:hypothetical protein
MASPVELEFQDAMENVTDNPIAAAILVLASSIRQHGTSFAFGDMLSHGICLGLKHGLEQSTVNVSVND